jgi:hypothetical protein
VDVPGNYPEIKIAQCIFEACPPGFWDTQSLPEEYRNGDFDENGDWIKLPAPQRVRADGAVAPNRVAGNGPLPIAQEAPLAAEPLSADADAGEAETNGGAAGQASTPRQAHEAVPPPSLPKLFDKAAAERARIAAVKLLMTAAPAEMPPLGRDMETAFITRVLPWPKEGEPGYVQLWWCKPDPEDSEELIWPKKSVRSVVDFFALRQWGLTKQFPHSFFCTALQRKKHTRGNKHTLAVKSLRMDIDVGKDKGYGSLKEAVIAVAEFCKQTGIPLPNAWVCSGSGLHVYWIGKEALAIEQWLPYAQGLKAFAMEHGLKADHGITADLSRVLRVPGTFNSKADLRRPVY